MEQSNLHIYRDFFTEKFGDSNLLLYICGVNKLLNMKHYSSYFKISHGDIVKAGVFDGFTEKDVLLHVDPMLLKNCTIPEFKGAYQKYLDYFNEIVTLTSGMSNPAIKQRCFREICRKMQFPEVVSTGLGYSKSNTKGSGISGRLSRQLADSCVEIIEAGIKDPAFFTLLPFIEEKIGADRISDMTIDILLEDFLNYTQRVAEELGIKCNVLKYKNVKYQVPFINGKPYLLIPQTLLAHLPIARSYDDIDKVCDYNRELRRRVCKAIGINMYDFDKMKKNQRKQAILAHSALLNDLLSYSKKLDVLGYNFASDELLLYADLRMSSLVMQQPMSLGKYVNNDDIDANGIAREIIVQYKTMIENNHMYWLLYNDNHKFRNEKAAQLLFYMMAHFYCEANNIDLSRECNPGVGELDFKLSNGFRKKVLIEVKRASSTSLISGYTKQLSAYEKAERTEMGYYLVIKDKANTEGSIRKLLDTRLERMHQGENCPEIIIVDALEKKSASKLR